MLKMNKKTLAAFAKAIKALDVDLWGMAKDTEEYKEANEARMAMGIVILNHGYFLSCDGKYALIKNKNF